jgi:broad specificity phosphatase PhoE
MTTVILVRHGSTEWNRTRRAQGLADIDLDDEGREQASAVAERLRDTHLDAVYASALKRAIETAEAIADTHGLTVQSDAAFNEIDQGDWTGLTTDEIGRRWPQMWGSHRHYTARPGGEAPADVRKRSLRGLRRVVEVHPEGTVVLVSHGGTIRWLSAEALGYDDHASASIRGLRNGEAVSIEAELVDGELRLSELNRLDHRPVRLDDDPNA